MGQKPAPGDTGGHGRRLGDSPEGSTFELSTDTHALTSEQVDLGVARNDWLRASWLATVEVSAMPTGDMPVCVGIAEETDIDVYLADVAQGEVTWNSDDDPVHLSCEDENAPGVPAEQDFWMTSSEGRTPWLIIAAVGLLGAGTLCLVTGSVLMVLG